MPRVPHKVQRALQRERAERESKGIFRDESSAGDYSRFESNFSRPLASSLAEITYGSSAFKSQRFGSVSAAVQATAARDGAGAAVSDTAIAACLTPAGRNRVSVTSNLGAFSSTASVSTTPAATPPGRSGISVVAAGT